MSTVNTGNSNNEKKDKIRKRYQNAYSANLEIIHAKPKVDFFQDADEKRVAIYVRVSTDSAQQTSSFEIQQKYYSDFVARHPSWRLVKIYADEGISGTSLRRRDAFNQMMDDCENGSIDLIITKNVQRWSRNILDGIGCVRKLAERKPPIGVFFENEGLYSLDPDKQTILSIHSTLAEQEARSKSASMNSSIEMRFSHGIFLTPPLLGYDNDGDGNLTVNQEEADTVRMIFYMYLSGRSTEEVAEMLMTLDRRTKPGNFKWTAGGVLCVLKNERYYGAVLSRKTWTPNFLNHKAIKNRGDHPQYLKTDNHEPIISRDDFIAAQKMISNAKYGNDSFLPKLRVCTDGAFRGFVSVNHHWGSFTAKDYHDASLSVTEDRQ